jgi:hypothetical protein
MVSIPDGLFYYVGEKPPPLPCRFEDKDGVLDASISGATITAKCKIDDASETSVSCTNNGDGTFTIDWDTGTSDFALPTGIDKGLMRIDIEVAASPRLWHMDRVQIPVKRRS